MKTIATVFGLGYVPLIPGTCGSAVGLGLFWILSGNPLHQIIGTTIAIGLALWSAGPAAKQLGKADPGAVIIDEVAGMMVVLLLLPVALPVYLGGFVLFRLLDVFKPFGIRRLERLPGSWGIVLDDLAAGLCANGILRLALLFL